MGTDAEKLKLSLRDFAPFSSENEIKIQYFEVSNRVLHHLNFLPSCFKLLLSRADNLFIFLSFNYFALPSKLAAWLFVFVSRLTNFLRKLASKYSWTIRTDLLAILKACQNLKTLRWWDYTSFVLQQIGLLYFYTDYRLFAVWLECFLNWKLSPFEYIFKHIYFNFKVIKTFFENN